MDYSLPGSSVHGILQARILERVAISFSRDIPDKKMFKMKKENQLRYCLSGTDLNASPNISLMHLFKMSVYYLQLICASPLEKEMASHSSVLAWRIPGTGEPGGLPSMGSHRVRHN